MVKCTNTEFMEKKKYLKYRKYMDNGTRKARRGSFIGGQ